jgi:hypothetical protein
MSTQLDDLRTLRADAQRRGWSDEQARHSRVEASLQQHLDRLRGGRKPDQTS